MWSSLGVLCPPPSLGVQVFLQTRVANPSELNGCGRTRAFLQYCQNPLELPANTDCSEVVMWGKEGTLNHKRVGPSTSPMLASSRLPTPCTLGVQFQVRPVHLVFEAHTLFLVFVQVNAICVRSGTLSVLSVWERRLLCQPGVWLCGVSWMTGHIWSLGHSLLTAFCVHCCSWSPWGSLVVLLGEGLVLRRRGFIPNLPPRGWGWAAGVPRWWCHL